jgi:exodeoxyribonuclease VII small subunit
MAFEADLKKIEKIVQDLSAGEKTLDESLELYKDGLALLKKCQKHLQTAEQKVKVLTAENGVLKEKDFAG